jgi:hypothetical protein
MTDKIDAFIAEIRARPEFIAAAAVDRTKADGLAAMEDGLAGLYQDPTFIDIFDELDAVICRRDLSIKQKLDEVTRVLTLARDAIMMVH